LKFLTGSYPTDKKAIFQASGESGRADLSLTLFKIFKLKSVTY